jgi:hypothetical protein
MGRNLLEVAQELIRMEGKSEFTVLQFKDVKKEGKGGNLRTKSSSAALLAALVYGVILT